MAGTRTVADGYWLVAAVEMNAGARPVDPFAGMAHRENGTLHVGGGIGGIGDGGGTAAAMGGSASSGGDVVSWNAAACGRAHEPGC